jgi:hypothetical protein
MATTKQDLFNDELAALLDKWYPEIYTIAEGQKFGSFILSRSVCRGRFVAVGLSRSVCRGRFVAVSRCRGVAVGLSRSVCRGRFVAVSRCRG